jgi:hypothetical protein
VTLNEILADVHALEEELLDLERKYGLRSETFYAAYMSGEETEDDAWALDFSEWASIYRSWLARRGESVLVRSAASSEFGDFLPLS